MAVSLILALFAGGAQSVQLAGGWALGRRFDRPAPPVAPADLPPVTVIRPICGLDYQLDRTLASTFDGVGPQTQILFCAAAPDDPAIAVAERQIALHPGVDAQVLTGDDRISGNPKLNNVAKGWRAARHPLIAIIDSNVALPPDYLGQLVAAMGPDTGLVTSPPAGIEPQGFWSEVEAGFLNTYQDRWQLIADEIGSGFAQGKVLFWRRDVLEAAGGIAALGADMAEDVASTKTVRDAGLTVRVVPRPFPQPLGRRSATEVWQRQVRWARVRRLGFPAIFCAEILTGGIVPLAGLAVLTLMGVLPWPVLPAFFVLWYGAEWELARRAGWPSSLVSIAAWVLRDAMIPLVWLASWRADGFVWRGTAMAPGAYKAEARTP